MLNKIDKADLERLNYLLDRYSYTRLALPISLIFMGLVVFFRIAIKEFDILTQIGSFFVVGLLVLGGIFLGNHELVWLQECNKEIKQIKKRLSIK